MIKAIIKTIHTILKGSYPISKYNHLSPNYTTMLLFLLSCYLKSIVNPKLHQSHPILWRKFLGKHKWRPQLDLWKQFVMAPSNKHFLSPSCVYAHAHTHTHSQKLNKCLLTMQIWPAKVVSLKKDACIWTDY